MVPRLDKPIVLVHGLLGFDELKLGPFVLARYFPKIDVALQQAGNRVLIPRLSPTEGIARRAEQLAEFLDREVPGETVHLFGHSMGGLDSRYLISRLGFADRVRSLTTIGTPHRGTVFADWGVRKFERLLSPFFSLFGYSKQAFLDLTAEHCGRFNEDTPDAPGVRYFSVAGDFCCTWRNWDLLLPARMLAESDGANDGLVSVKSATYGESCDIWTCDHLGLVNWPNRFMRWKPRVSDRVPFYAGLMKRLIDEGL